MSISPNEKEKLRKRYDADFLSFDENRIKDGRSAANRAREMRTTVNARLDNGKALTASPKRQCAALIRYYQGQNNAAQLRNMEKTQRQIISMDLAYIDSCAHRDKFIQYLLEHPEISLVASGISELYNKYVKAAEKELRKAILGMVQTDAEMEYTQALAMERRFILHIGGTNSGKTYESVERLKKAKCGVYAGPLRLLALEIYDKLRAAEIPCSMVTGEEQHISEDSRVTACTAEMVDLDQEYDVAVIDEAQMISDPFRGHAWSRLVMGIKAKEVHICMAPEAENIIRRILKRCHVKYDVVRHSRNTELVFEDRPFDIDRDLTKGDALILFSKRMVLDVAARLELQGVKASVIYGNLPPQIRKKQFELFLNGENDVVVATDAIGLGVNLPIRRIVFMEHMKFDGKERRPLNEFEVRQIAGRAGRRGMYDTGYVTATTEAGLEHIKRVYPMNHTIEYAIIGFPQVLLDIDEPIDQILTSWYSIKPNLDVYRKMDIKEMLVKYKSLYNIRDSIAGFSDKHEVYNMISCDVDLGNEKCMAMWRYYCRTYTADVSIKFPVFDEVRGDTRLERAETYYKMLDLYNQFSVRFGKIMDEERVVEERLKTEDIILTELGKSKKFYLRRCNYCGKLLPVGARSSLCDKCYYSVAGARQESGRRRS